MIQKKRQVFEEQLSQFPKQKQVFVDETGFDQKARRLYAYAAKGQRVFDPVPGKKFKRINLIGACRENRLIVSQLYQGTVNSATFIDWIKHDLCPVLEKGDVVIMDNAPWHKKKDIANTLKEVGATLLPLPPYSPDFNDIEPLWATIKTACRYTAYQGCDPIQIIQTNLERYTL